MATPEQIREAVQKLAEELKRNGPALAKALDEGAAKLQAAPAPRPRRSGHPKLMNEYASALGSKLYTDTPKAVFAAVAVSVLTTGGDRLDEAVALFLEEWRCLHSNGIVPQAPPKDSA